MVDVTEKEPVRILLNGRDWVIRSDPDMPLLYVLREICGLKGTRFGCGDAACGACTVVVDGVAVTSCDLPLSAVAGKRVETVESLDTEPPHPLLKAALEIQAAQCGYCLPGILMAAKALLDKTGNPSRAEIVAALDDNLCRCGAHLRILRAVERAAALRPETAE